MKAKMLLIALAIAVVIAALIAYGQTRPAAGTYTIYPTHSRDGPISIAGVAGTDGWVFARPLLTIDTPQRVQYAEIIVNATGNGTITAVNPASNTAGVITLWDGTWDQYAPVAEIGNIVIEAQGATNKSENSTLTPEAWLLRHVPRETTVSDPDNLLNWSALANLDTPSRGEQDFSYRLRGNHRLVVYANSSLTVSIDKQDLNMYPGEDTLTLKLVDLISGTYDNATIGDDGVTNNSNNGSAIRTNITFSNLADSIYELQINAVSNGSDFTYNLSLSNGPVAFRQQLFAISPMNITVLCTQTCILKAITYHTPFLQTILVDDQPLALLNRSVQYNLSIPSGMHRVSIPKGDVVLSGFNQASVDGGVSWTPYVFTNAENGKILVRSKPIIGIQQSGFTAVITMKGTGNVTVNSITTTLS